MNLMITMLLGGLWHGAAWNFVIWGAYHGALLVLYKIASKLNIIKSRVLSIFITQYLIFLGWLIFRVADVEHLTYSVKKYVFLDFFSAGVSQIIPFLLDNKFAILLIVTFIYLHVLSYKVHNILEKVNSLKLSHWSVYVGFVLLLLFLFTPSLSKAFIYFQF